MNDIATLQKITINRDETSSKVYFHFDGDFCKEEITSIMQLAPIYAFSKGEQRQSNLVDKDGNPTYHKFSRWCYGTDFENTRDIEEQCNRIIAQLNNKIPEILSIVERYNCETGFEIVSVIEKSKSPGMILNQKILNFCTAVKADIDVDIYANAYDDSENSMEVDI